MRTSDAFLTPALEEGARPLPRPCLWPSNPEQPLREKDKCHSLPFSLPQGILLTSDCQTLGHQRATGAGCHIPYLYNGFTLTKCAPAPWPYQNVTLLPAAQESGRAWSEALIMDHSSAMWREDLLVPLGRNLCCALLAWTLAQKDKFPALMYCHPQMSSALNKQSLLLLLSMYLCSNLCSGT